MLEVNDTFGTFAQSLAALVQPQNGGTYYRTPQGAEFLRNAYLYSTWFGKIVNIPAEDSIKAGRGWQGADENQISALEGEEQRLQLWPRLLTALVWSRLFGGALIVMGGLPGASEQPLELDRVRAGSLTFINVVDIEHAQVLEWERNPLQPGFGQPLLYGIGTARVHASRIVRLVGREWPGMFNAGNAWGESVWSSTGNAVMAADMAMDEVMSLVRESKGDIIRLEGLAVKMSTAAAEEQLVKRWIHFLEVKRRTGVAMYDKADEWEQRQISFDGVPEIVQTIWTNLAGASDIPLVRLVGTSAKGLNATGEGDLKNYYDAIEANRKLRLEPALQTLDEILIRSTLGKRPDQIFSAWNPLYQMSAVERATVQKTKAETAQIIVGMAIIDDEVIAKTLLNEMVESGEWAGLEKAMQESANAGVIDPIEREEREREAAEAMAGLKAANQNTNFRQAANDAAPRPLYVYRKLLNGADLIAWAKAQGFAETLAADDLHVTIARSKTPVNWMEMGESWQGEVELPEGGPRLLDQFGDATVLLFNSSEFRWRHEAMKERGASWDHPEYQPHVTISYAGRPENLDQMKPYTGKLVFGPEMFEDIEDGFKERVQGA